MSNRKQGQTQEQASAKAGVSERSGGGSTRSDRRVGDQGAGLAHTQGPFAEVWDSEVVGCWSISRDWTPRPCSRICRTVTGRFGNGEAHFQRRVKA